VATTAWSAAIAEPDRPVDSVEDVVAVVRAGAGEIRHRHPLGPADRDRCRLHRIVGEEEGLVGTGRGPLALPTFERLAGDGRAVFGLEDVHAYGVELRGNLVPGCRR
jgi:hypothetical protein